MFTVHHLGKSQSERVVWLCEELEIPYELKRYARDAKTMLAPFKCPRWIAFLDELPKTATGKIQRFKLREARHD